jgi:hypothetical protein
MTSVSAASLVALMAFVAPAHAQANVAGNWTFSISGPQGLAEVAAVLAQDGSTVTGELSLPQVEASEMSDGMIEGNKLTFLLHVSFDGQWYTLDAMADVDGDTMLGSLNMAEMGSMPFSGKRVQG